MSANPNKALWEKGDFTRIASSMRASGEALVGKLGITRGMKVMDLGCGDGTTALPEARLGADVLGVDIAANLVAAGNRRATEAGLSNLRFAEGDACQLTGIADASCERDTFVFTAPVPPSEYLTGFRSYYGPTMNAYAAAEASGRAEDLHRELDALFNAHNQSGDTRSTRIPATYLRVTVKR